ncbi:MAG TPA: hypothetical protein VHD62_17255 [Opitutaceae bacterium]|nr:hypothetical protein [Opitutaceae bacterium]
MMTRSFSKRILSRPARWLSPLAAVLFGLATAAQAAPVEFVFDGRGAVSKKWTLKELNPDLPSDWSGYNFLVLEFRASSPQRFELELHTPGKVIAKRLHPFQNARVRAAIPLKYFSAAASGGNDLASLTNKLGGSYFMSIEFGGYGPIDEVQAVGVTMRDPVGAPKLEIQSVKLAKDSPGDEVLEPKLLVDEFGQWIPADWPGKAKTLDDLKKSWAEEASSLGKNPLPDRDRFGGFAKTQAKATGFFRVEQIDGKWWFIDPEGHYFFSNGANGISTVSATRITGREPIFTALPPADLVPPTPGRGGGGFGGGAAGGVSASFYTWNLVRRYGSGETWRAQWAETTARRMADWGLNTFYGGDQNLMTAEPRRPFVITIREWQGAQGQSFLGLTDVYADDFESRVDAIAERSCAPYKNDPFLLGYFIGNEPSWPTRENALADMILAAPTTGLNRELKKWFAEKGDTLETRRAFAFQAFERYLTVIIAAVKKHDPNHLNLGIRFGGSPPPEVIRFGRLFDVYSHNIYQPSPDPARIQRYYDLTGRPILIGEFHNGTPGRGMSPGLVQSASPEEKGFLYRCYVENAAANPAIVGAHWFQFIDQPNTGRNDGENYNIGMVDVTDRPYPDMVAAMKLAHQNVLEVRLGRMAPAQRRTGADAQDFLTRPSGTIPAPKQ